MNRYIGFQDIFIRNRKAIIYYIDKCNNCPLMVYKKENSSCECRVFKDNKHDNIIKDSVTGCYKNQVCETLDIPHWCDLPKDLDELYEKNRYYIITKECLLSVHEPNMRKIPVVYNTGTFDNINEVVFDSIDENLDKEDEITKTENNFTIIKNNKCSLCGEYKEGVERKINSGMCGDCYTKTLNDEKLIKKAFINNFRLKRKITVINKEYKTIQ